MSSPNQTQQFLEFWQQQWIRQCNDPAFIQQMMDWMQPQAASSSAKNKDSPPDDGTRSTDSHHERDELRASLARITVSLELLLGRMDAMEQRLIRIERSVAESAESSPDRAAKANA